MRIAGLRRSTTATGRVRAVVVGGGQELPVVPHVPRQRLHTVTVTVDDGHTSGSDSFHVAVSNAAPSVQAGPDATIAAGGTLSRPGSFSDPGSLDSWTATVNYGDGSGTQPLLLPGLDHSFQLLHTYTSPGQFTVTVTVTDDDGGAGSDTVTVTVEVHRRPPICRSRNRTHPIRRSSAAPSSIR